jgi:hypothetical protein
MAVDGKLLDWDESRPITDLIAESKQRQDHCWVVSREPDLAAISTAIPLERAADLIALRDPVATECWTRLSRCLPVPIYFLACQPSDHLAVAISMRALTSNQELVRAARSLNELVLRLSASCETLFIDNVHTENLSPFSYPALTFADSVSRGPSVQDMIGQIAMKSTRSASTSLAALKAGLYLINNYFDDSHSCSQSIEGLGALHTGDYWHAILHRREPDYGNSKYWFRHVGRHPIYRELAETVDHRLNQVNSSLAGKLRHWRTRLIVKDVWDPFAFVDLCAAAESDGELRDWCEQVQYDEMLLLLEATAGEAIESRK